MFNYPPCYVLERNNNAVQEKEILEFIKHFKKQLYDKIFFINPDDAAE